MDHTRRFDRFEKEFFHEWARRNPLLGTALGLHGECDERMPEGSLAKLQDDVRFLARYETEFSQIDPKRLPPARGIDRDAMIRTIRWWIFEREEMRFWESVPEAPRLVGEAIFQLLSRNYAPLAHRLKCIMKRLEALPKYLEESKTKLRVPVKLFVENELETLTRLPGFFNTLKDVSRDNIPKTPERNLHRLIESAQNALEKYSDWLIVDVLPECREEHAMGESRYRKLLAAMGVTQSPGALLSWAQSEMERLREKLKELGRAIKRKVPVDDVRELIKQQHPETFDGVLRLVRDQVSKSKQFVSRSRFAELPHGETLFVVETPSYLRHQMPFGGYLPPSKMEGKLDGYYFVTPGDCDSDKLKEHNAAALANMTVHQGYPGHHLHAAWTASGKSLVRTLSRDPITAEGWAFYCEERMKDLGFDDTPPSRFWMTMEQLFRAARIVMDVKIVTGKMGFQDGVEYLIDTIGMDRVAAEAEMRRYVVNPGYQVACSVGKERIKELKKWARDRMKGRFTETFFHTAVLQAGPIATDLLKRDLEWRIVEEIKKPKVIEPPPKPAKKVAKTQKPPAPSALRAPAGKPPMTAAKTAPAGPQPRKSRK